MRRGNRGGGGFNGGQGSGARPLLRTPTRLDGPPGPLLIDRYHGLQDIDKELELIKQKRMLIKEQKQIITNEFNREQMNYNQPQFFNPNPDYSNSYGAPGMNSGMNPGMNPGMNSFMNSGMNPGMNPDVNPDMHPGINPGMNYIRPQILARKRQVVVWDYENQMQPPPKRFAGSDIGINVMEHFGSRLGPPPATNQMPYYQIHQPVHIQHRMRRPTPLKLLNRKNQVNKPKPLMSIKTTPIKKPTTKKTGPKPNTAAPVAIENLTTDKKKFVARYQIPDMNKDEKLLEDYILHSDKMPSVKVVGRLELALGKIIKEIKDMYSKQAKYKIIFAHMSNQRILKQKIRERIKSVMYGKLVNSCDIVYQVYRDVHNKDTDLQMLKSTLEIINSRKPLDEANRERRFKNSLNSLYDKIIDNMLAKITETCSNMLKQINDEPVPDTENKDTTSKVDDDEDVIMVSQEDTNNKGITVIDLSSDDDVIADLTSLGLTNVTINSIKKIMLEKSPDLIKDKFMPSIKKLLYNDDAYEVIRKSIEADVRRQIAGKSKTSDGQTTADQATEATAKIYHVKVIGRPFLPKRKTMQNFLHRFTPLYIKKHKSINNLLFVGLPDKTQHDLILQANSTHIGKSILEIKTSEKTAEPAQASHTVITIEDTLENSNAAELDQSIGLITPDLDSQITDLLSSIKNEHVKSQSAENEIADAVEDLTKDEELPNEEVDKGAKMETVEIMENEVEKETIAVASEIVATPKNVDNEAVENSTKATKNETENVENESKNIGNATDQTEYETKDADKQLEPITEENQVTKYEVTENKEATETNEKGTDDSNVEMTDVESLKKETQNTDDKPLETIKEDIQEPVEEVPVKDGKVEALKSNAKESGRATPTRMSSRLASIAPSSIRTRRASRYESN